MPTVRVLILDDTTGKRVVKDVDEDILDGVGVSGGAGCVGGVSASYVFTPLNEVGGCDANGN